MDRLRSMLRLVILISLVDSNLAQAVSATHGAIVGDVSDSQATVWSRADANSTMYVSLRTCRSGVGEEELMGQVDVDSSGDYTGQVNFEGLVSETCYKAEVQFGNETVGVSAQATFYTAPAVDIMRPVRFAWSGDIAGQNICRDLELGFPIFNVLNEVEDLEFFINLGDAIYGDGICQETALTRNAQVPGDFIRSSDLDNFWAHWRYNLDDEGYQSFISSQAYFMTWDDHEVINDFGPDYDTRSSPPYTAGEHLMPIGMEAFINYNPIRAVPDPTVEDPIFYRSVRWGRAVELFILDTRQYRSLPTVTDTPANPKTMLGEAQLTWLKESLTNSTAIWKIVVTSVPLSLPTGAGDGERDGWANFEGDTGYEIELEDVLQHMQEGEMHDVVFITADVHLAQGIRYQPFPGFADFDVHEVIAGPLNAGLFPRLDLDSTFGPERLFVYTPQNNSLLELYNFSETWPWFNFGQADIDIDGNLTLSIINAESEVVDSFTLTPRDSIATDSPTSSPTSQPTPLMITTEPHTAPIAVPTASPVVATDGTVSEEGGVSAPQEPVLSEPNASPTDEGIYSSLETSSSSIGAGATGTENSAGVSIIVSSKFHRMGGFTLVVAMTLATAIGAPLLLRQ